MIPMLKHILAATLALAALALLRPAVCLASPTSEVEKYLNGLATWSADFKQTIDDGHGKVVRSAAGKLYLQKPGKFRWDYSEPSEQLILADGKQIWFYDKDL
jgi:outer membrane lipoprotein carrier protein